MTLETQLAALEQTCRTQAPHLLEDVRRLLEVQSRLVVKVERLTAAMVRYASMTYGT